MTDIANNLWCFYNKVLP